MNTSFIWQSAEGTVLSVIKIEKTDVFGWEATIRGMRNPLNSWDKSDSDPCWSPTAPGGGCWTCKNKDVENCNVNHWFLGENDLALMKKLIKAGSDHSKFMRMICVNVDVTAPLYWWKEYDTYKVGTVANSCSTMHKIHDKQFTLADFSCDRMFDTDNGLIESEDGTKYLSPLTFFEGIVHQLNVYREKYLATKDKVWWEQMIQLLPTNYNQKRTLLLNYAVLRNIYHSRKNHKLQEWHEFCAWVESLPYSELITM